MFRFIALLRWNGKMKNAGSATNHDPKSPMATADSLSTPVQRWEDIPPDKGARNNRAVQESVERKIFEESICYGAPHLCK
jgi:hypothetical protein